MNFWSIRGFAYVLKISENDIPYGVSHTKRSFFRGHNTLCDHLQKSWKWLETHWMEHALLIYQDWVRHCPNPSRYKRIFFSRRYPVKVPYKLDRPLEKKTPGSRDYLGMCGSEQTFFSVVLLRLPYWERWLRERFFWTCSRRIQTRGTLYGYPVKVPYKRLGPPCQKIGDRIFFLPHQVFNTDFFLCKSPPEAIWRRL